MDWRQNLVPISQSVHPFILLDNYLTEPLVLTKKSKLVV